MSVVILAALSDSFKFLMLTKTQTHTLLGMCLFAALYRLNEKIEITLMFIFSLTIGNKEKTCFVYLWRQSCLCAKLGWVNYWVWLRIISICPLNQNVNERELLSKLLSLRIVHQIFINDFLSLVIFLDLHIKTSLKSFFGALLCGESLFCFFTFNDF